MHLHAAPGAVRQILRTDHHLGVRLGGGRSADPNVHPGQTSGKQVRVGHVVGTVPDIGQRQPGQLLLALSDGLQVREHLARVVLVCQPVDHGNPGIISHFLQALLARGAPDDGGHMATEHSRSVTDRLAATELETARHP